MVVIKEFNPIKFFFFSIIVGMVLFGVLLWLL